MYQYLAIIWERSNPLACENAVLLCRRIIAQERGWTSVVSSTGVAVYLRDHEHNGRVQPYLILPRSTGIIFGQLFNHPTNGQKATVVEGVDEQTATDLVRSGGRLLVENYWGNFIAFLRDNERNGVYVIRDCSGKLPIFRDASFCRSQGWRKNERLHLE